MLLKFPSNFQRKSSPFPTCSKTISNQITSPLRLLKNFDASYVTLSPPLKVKIYKPLKKKHFFLANLQDISKFQIIKIFGEPQNFVKGQNSKGSIHRSKYFPQMSKCFHFFFFLQIIFCGAMFHLLCPIFFNQSFFVKSLNPNYFWTV